MGARTEVADDGAPVYSAKAARRRLVNPIRAVNNIAADLSPRRPMPPAGSFVWRA
jgi:hypothetical protein